MIGLPFLDLAKYTKKQRQAAKELWAEVKQGKSFEIPVSLSTDDDTMKAVELLLRQHPEVTLAHERSKEQKAEKNLDGSSMVTFQSRGLVVGMRKSFKVSDSGLEMLARGGYHPEAANLLKMFDQHLKFMQTNGQDVNAAVKRAQGESADRNRVEVSGGGKLEPREAMPGWNAKLGRTEKAEMRPQAIAKVERVLREAKEADARGDVAIAHPDIEKGSVLCWRSQYSVKMEDGWTYNILWRELSKEVQALYVKTLGWRVRGGRVEQTEEEQARSAPGKKVADAEFSAGLLATAEEFAQKRSQEMKGIIMLEEQVELLDVDSDDPIQFVLYKAYGDSGERKSSHVITAIATGEVAFPAGEQK